MWETVAVVLLALCCLLSVVLTALRLPGTWLLVLAAFGYAWWTDWAVLGPLTLTVLVGTAIIGEVVELGMSAVVARKAGASRPSAWGGLAGGILGMFFLSTLFTIPFPVVGTLIGAVLGATLGCFGGAMIVELSVRRKLVQGTKVGLFSALGFVLGTLAKTAFALAMSGIVLTSVLYSPNGAKDKNGPPAILERPENRP